MVAHTRWFDPDRVSRRWFTKNLSAEEGRDLKRRLADRTSRTPNRGPPAAAAFAVRRPEPSQPGPSGFARTACISRRCAFAGRCRMALAISLRPRRSAIRMVAELAPLVDFSSRVRSACGTSSTDRYTSSEPHAEISTVEVWNMPAGFPFGSPQCGHADADSAYLRPQAGHFIKPPPSARGAFPFPLSYPR